MQKCILLALVWFAFFQGTPPVPNIQVRNGNETSSCSLPRPSNVHATVAGTYYIYFEWDHVPGAAYYRVKAFNSPSNTLIYTRLVTATPARNGIFIDDLTPGSSLNIEVYSVCSNGVESPSF